MRIIALVLAILSAPAAAAAQEPVREGLEIADEIGLAARAMDGGARYLLRNPVLELEASVRFVFPNQHGVGLGFDFALDTSGEAEVMNLYALDLFYFHPWAFHEDWEVSPIFGISCGWADAGLTSCTTDCNAEQKMAQERLDGLDAFLAGGRVGFSLDYVLEFLHLGLTATVRMMVATGDEAPFHTWWQQSLLARAGFRLDL